MILSNLTISIMMICLLLLSLVTMGCMLVLTTSIKVMVSNTNLYRRINKMIK